ncbi:BirA family transcriptional regulator, biotin operon repressor / biotin-[acetyl-CoA-carboxylase] ligase [Lutibacter oricola]|uniref:BirA family transcriptional regulator, biotin operon repressor / biotin-[acetyl-CoA-carboxylase] ligase n=1 Tax=Lutibacter oricola TaxID=762486 RepID=A0A1H2ZC86_9FLAO|nr:biotin--[acetyl-CoA-carboxylase] ligase [Lutibacter oricola]SDX14946.1 BirA family transcriptional regulator, biotin operon repressor / biotin-[acetyl-CoA-carboxylase] ligase [Lutibacter oricola]
MNIIKLNAIDSTNLYLKRLADDNELENFTVAVARQQTAGRGQMGTNWVSEKNKNLTFSMLVNFEALSVNHQFYVSMAVAIAVVEVLKGFVNNSLFIKWPNDILADKQKVCGILIENSLKGVNVKHSIIGIGLNVNQEIFPTNIGKVSSMKLLSGNEYKTDDILVNLINKLKYYLQLVNEAKFKQLTEIYYANLFKLNTPALFEESCGSQFMGKIIGVEVDGRLIIELENENTRKFNLKEIKLASI